jgi:hypothetical protein
VAAVFKNAAVEHGATLGIDVEVVNRNPETRGFQVVKRRLVVERTIDWIMMHRRLPRDYETLTTSSEAMIHIASIDNLARRITDDLARNALGRKGRSAHSKRLSVPLRPSEVLEGHVTPYVQLDRSTYTTTFPL